MLEEEDIAIAIITGRSQLYHPVYAVCAIMHEIFIHKWTSDNRPRARKD